MVNDTFLIFLQDFLCAMNKQQHRYKSAWLHPIDDLTGRPRFRLYVRADVELDCCSDEFDLIFDALYDRRDMEPFKYISGIVVLDRNNQLHCQTEDIKVFNEAEAC